MRMRSWWPGVMLAAGLSLAAVLSPDVWAQKKGPQKSPEEQKADVINDVIAAYRLAEFGRDKKNPAPEALIAAGALLRRLSVVKMEPITEEPVVKDAEGAGKGEKGQTVKAPDLAAEAEELFEEAQGMAAKLGLNLDPLLKQARARDYSGVYRALPGGPRTISRTIRGRQTQTFKIQFLNNLPCAVGFRASFPMRVQGIRHDTDVIWLDALTMYGSHHDRPHGSSGGRTPVTIRVMNPSSQPGTFQLFVN